MVDEQKPAPGEEAAKTRQEKKEEKAARKADEKQRKQAEKRARQESTDTEAYVATTRDKIRIGLIWVLEYWRELFNFRFDKYMIIQVIPGVYGLALTGLGLGLIYLSVEAFLNSPIRGLFYFFFASPLAFVVLASILRALLEFYIVVFKISEHVDELVGLRDTVDRLGGISDTVNEISTVTRRLPFWSAMAGRRRVRRKVEVRQREAARNGGDSDDGGQDGQR